MPKGERFSIYMDKLVAADARKYAKEKKISLSQAIEQAMIREINQEWVGYEKYINALEKIESIVKKANST